MKRLVTIIDVLLLIMGASLMFCFYAVFWGDSLFWLRIVGTLVVSIVLLRNINNVLERDIEATHIDKTTDDIIKAFKDEAKKPIPPNTIMEREGNWYQKQTDAARERFKEETKQQVDNPLENYVNHLNAGRPILDKNGNVEFSTIFFDVKEKPTPTKRGRKKLDEFIEGMSPIARDKYEKELKSKAKRPSARVKGTPKKSTEGIGKSPRTPKKSQSKK